MINIQYILVIFLVICAISVCVTNNLLVSLIIFTAYSLVMSVIWLFIESPDLAITEAAAILILLASPLIIFSTGIDSVSIFIASVNNTSIFIPCLSKFLYTSIPSSTVFAVLYKKNIFLDPVAVRYLHFPLFPKKYTFLFLVI